MPIEFHTLHNVQELTGVGELKLERTRALLAAIEAHADYSLKSILALNRDGAALEILVVDVETHDVPPESESGIKFRERLALCVPGSPKDLVDVIALRTNFPVLIHQNNGDIAAPASLCLYFEKPSVVVRTWTPQNFLRRIQWWLEMSAKGTLHPADQPVEHLFFAARDELVLPWNFDQLFKYPELKFGISRTPERPDGGVTFFIKPQDEKHPQAKDWKIAHLEFTLPAVVQGFIERDPSNLGSLVDYLSQRGADLVAPLKAQLQSRVGNHGVTVASDENFTIILLRIPIVREQGSLVERTAHRAFLLRYGPLSLGLKLGALFELDGKFYNAIGVMNAQAATTWREEPIASMEVLQQNSKSSARRQSGIPEVGPNAVLVGVGSLGSAMLNIWDRSGWGTWKIIDNDRVKPHNLSRHTAFTGHIGFSKVEAVKDLHFLAMGDAEKIDSIEADACDFSNEQVLKAIKDAQLVIDASTTLEYPRLASTAEDLARHASIFIAPDGDACVLMAEDKDRNIRLRSLEAQYYRAIVQSEWGAEHLRQENGAFWSGASCRDLSLVLPYSKIMAHAALLAEQIQRIAASPVAELKVWHRNPTTGAVAQSEFQPANEIEYSFQGMHVYLDAEIVQKLRHLRAESLPNETGGVLLGYFDLTLQSIWIVDCLPAPPDSKASPAEFERGVEGLATAVGEASRRTLGTVGYVGEWHSHPTGHSANPSNDDLLQLTELALGMAQDGLPVLQLIVGETDFQILAGKVLT